MLQLYHTNNPFLEANQVVFFSPALPQRSTGLVRQYEIHCVKPFVHQPKTLIGELSASVMNGKGPIVRQGKLTVSPSNGKAFQHEGCMTKCGYVTTWDENVEKFSLITAPVWDFHGGGGAGMG